jgi:hypothetical protein
VGQSVKSASLFTGADVVITPPIVVALTCSRYNHIDMDLNVRFNEIQSMAFGYWLMDSGSSAYTCLFVSSLCLAASYKPHLLLVIHQHSTLPPLVGILVWMCRNV